MGKNDGKGKILESTASMGKKKNANCDYFVNSLGTYSQSKFMNCKRTIHTANKFDRPFDILGGSNGSKSLIKIEILRWKEGTNKRRSIV
jgi:hypothetical protein